MQIADSPRAKEFLQLLRQRLSDKTLSHCVFTATLLASFAPQAGVTDEQAVTAGLLHDLYKDADDEATLEAAERFRIPVTQLQRQKPALLHGALAAEECRRNLGIEDDEVLDAIEWHTTGKPGLGPVGLALYLADFAEPSRRHPQAAEARNILRRQGWRAALLYASEQKLEHVNSRTHADPITVEFHQWLVESFDRNE